MARGARQVVIIVVAGSHLATFGLQRDHGLARPDRGKAEGAILTGGVAFGRAPGGGQIVAQHLRQGVQRGLVVRNRPELLFDAQPGAQIAQAPPGRDVIAVIGKGGT